VVADETSGHAVLGDHNGAGYVYVEDGRTEDMEKHK
jgi:hypothetical protein